MRRHVCTCYTEVSTLFVCCFDVNFWTITTALEAKIKQSFGMLNEKFTTLHYDCFPALRALLVLFSTVCTGCMDLKFQLKACRHASSCLYLPYRSKYFVCLLICLQVHLDFIGMLEGETSKKTPGTTIICLQIHASLSILILFCHRRRLPRNPLEPP